MKNKIVFFLLFLIFKSNLFADNLLIQAKDVTIDKNKETTIFKNEVKIKTDDNKNIQSDKAIGMVEPKYAKVGQNLEMDILEKKHKVTVIEDSPYDPNNNKLRN